MVHFVERTCPKYKWDTLLMGVLYLRRLQDSERIALETEEEGAGILNTLRRQREQIENSRDTVYFIFHLLH